MATVTMVRTRRWSFDVSRDGFDDWPDELERQYTSTGRTFRPQLVTLAYTQRGDGPVKLAMVSIHGPQIVKGGALGRMVTEHHYSPPEGEWIQEILVATRSLVVDDLKRSP